MQKQIKKSIKDVNIGATRNNVDKPRLSRIFDAPHAMIAIARVLEHGDEEYGRGNWRKGLSWSETADSLLRHTLQFLNGEDIDPKSGLPHVDCMLTNAVFLSQYFNEGTGEDDRLLVG